MHYMKKYSEEFLLYTDGRIQNLYLLLDKYNLKHRNTEHMMNPYNIDRKRWNATKILNDIKVVQGNIQKAIFNVEKYKNILDNMDQILPDTETLKARSNTLEGLALTTVDKFHIPATDAFAALALENARTKYQSKKGGKTKRKKRRVS